MKSSLALLAVLFLGSSSSGALAAATAEEAQRLTAALQAYLGSDSGVVSVTPSGDTYALKLDAAPLFAKIKEPGFSASLSPFEMTLTDQGGGKWQVDQDQAVTFSLKAGEAVDMSGQIGNLKGSGIFDEAMGGFTSSTSDFSDFSFAQTVVEKGMATKVAYTMAKIHYETALTPSGDGADGTMKATMSGLTETISAPAAADGSTPPMDFTIAVTDGSQDGTVKGLKPRATLDLMAWAVAHPSGEVIKAAQAELKDKLRAVLPLFANINATSTMNGVTVATMMGQVGIARLDVDVEANGIVDDGRLREKFSVSGLSLPQGLVPPFAADLVPSAFTIDFNLGDFNLAAPAKLVIDNFDLTKEPPLPPGVEQQLLQALLPKGAVTIGLGPSTVIAKLFDLGVEGSMIAGPMGTPSGEATVRLKGLDGVLTALQAAPPEMGMQQMGPMVMMAKGMAKTEADGTLTWKIENTQQGGILINGVDVTKMGGQ